MVPYKARRHDVAGYRLSLLCNGDFPTGRFWEVILKTGTYGGTVVAGWHSPYFGKATLSRTTIPKASAPFSSNTLLANAKIPL